MLTKTDRVRAFGYFAAAGVAVTALDDVFAKSRSFSTLYRNLAAAVLAKAKGHETVCYCVEGSGLADRSVAELAARGVPLVFHPAAEKSAPVRAACPSPSYACLSACDLTATGYIEVDRSQPLVVTEIDTPLLAGAVKLKLAELCGDETEILFGVNGTVRALPLFELDRQPGYDDSACLLVRPQPAESRRRFGFRDLVDIVVRLRRPDGCPWDREQTHESIRGNLIEEAYEALGAVQEGDPDKMREELGDLLLQPVFHAVMSEEAGEFSVADLLSELCYKLVFRHSHIFGADRAEGGAEALAVWEKNKAAEKKQASAADAIADLPATFPAALYAAKVQKRAGPYAEGRSDEAALARLEACTRNLADCLRAREAGKPSAPKALERTGGELLYAAVDAVRRAHGEPELDLRLEAERRAARVGELERRLRAEGRRPEEIADDEWEALWNDPSR